MVINITISVCFFTWVVFSTLGSSLEDSGMNVTDLFKKDLDPELEVKFDQSIKKISSEKGKSATDSFINLLKVILPTKEFDISDMPAIPYPYPNLGEVLDNVNRAGEHGFAEGMRLFKEAENKNQDTKSEAMKLLEDAERRNRAILEKVLDEMPK